jgi:hypothetical protein
MASATAQNRVERNPEGPPGNRTERPACETQASILCDLQCYTRDYVQQQPEKAALICLGIGFILGWKLKPW